MLEKERLKTDPYWKTKDYFLEMFENDISSLSFILQLDKDLIDDFQNLRNTVIHLGIFEIPEYLCYDVLRLSLRIINQLFWHEKMYRYDMENNIEDILGNELYQRVIRNPDIFDLSCDTAIKFSEDIHYCIVCENESLGLLLTEEYHCFACGFNVHYRAIGFMKCPVCNFNELGYDCLQGPDSITNAKCGRCGYKTFVFECLICGDFSEIVNNKKYCKSC